MTTERRFGSRVDRWLVRTLIALTVISFIAAYQALVMPGGGKWFALVIILAGAGLPFWVLRSTVYTVSGDLLDIRSGPFSWRIRLGEIESVHPTRSPPVRARAVAGPPVHHLPRGDDVCWYPRRTGTVSWLPSASPGHPPDTRVVAANRAGPAFRIRTARGPWRFRPRKKASEEAFFINGPGGGLLRYFALHALDVVVHAEQHAIVKPFALADHLLACLVLDGPLERVHAARP